LEAVEEPEADRATFGKWFGYLKKVALLFERTGNALKAENNPKARRLLVDVKRDIQLANETIAGLEFHWCKLNSTRFV